MTPATEAELAEILAADDGQRYRICGGDSRGMTASVTANGVLSTTGLSGIRLYEPGALTIVAGAGTPLAEIDAALAGEGQMLAFEPMDHRPLLGRDGTPTIGGVVAGNVSGPRRVQAGACRDAMLGLRFVDGTGTVIRNGGRVMKNVTGYDLVRLLTGSRGSLGVLTEVALKVLPRPECRATLTLQTADAKAAVAAMSDAMTTPFDVTGAASEAEGGSFTTRLRLEGFDAAVRYRAEALSAALARHGPADVAIEDASTPDPVWEAIRDARAHANAPGAVWLISTIPTRMPDILADIRQTGDVTPLLDWAGGRAWLRQNSASDDPVALQNAIWRALSTHGGGHATLIRPPAGPRPDGLAQRHPAPAPLARIEAAIRLKFDPKGRLNPEPDKDTP